VHGFLHSDPHPGNIMVNKMPDGSPQIILLDHGLYRELTEEFRESYSGLWKSLILRDTEKIKYYSKK